MTPDHPHTHVVRAVQQLKVLSGPSEGGPASGGGTPYLNDLARSSYFMATESLHLTTFCLQYKPNLVAAVCIHIACKWTNFEVNISSCLQNANSHTRDNVSADSSIELSIPGLKYDTIRTVNLTVTILCGS